MKMDGDIKILGPGCNKCKEVVNTVRKVAKEQHTVNKKETDTYGRHFRSYLVLLGNK